GGGADLLREHALEVLKPASARPFWPGRAFDTSRTVSRGHNADRCIVTQLPIRSLKPVFIAAVLGAMCFAGSAQAQDACSGFKWPVETEMAWVTSPDAEAVKSGGDIAALPARAIELKLEPSPDVKLPVASGV